LPLAETLVWTTPRVTLARRISVFELVLGGPTRSTPATIAPAANATSTTIWTGLARRTPLRTPH
jgi:hypothetical protein